MSCTAALQGNKLDAFINYSANATIQDTLMPVGTLRYGRTVSTDIGETVEWRHW